MKFSCWLHSYIYYYRVMEYYAFKNMFYDLTLPTNIYNTLSFDNP